jgi:poly(hydroxyalkanoate) granule-associated protein
MATKTLKNKVQAKPPASKLGAPVLESARDVWLAGMGVLAFVQKEGDRLIGEGGKLFDRFVAEGVRFEGRTRDMAGEAVDDLREGVESTVESVRKQATEQLDRLEGSLGFSVADTLNRLGIPTAGDLDEVSVRIQKMSRQVNENWKGLNKVIDARVKALLGRLEVPAAGDFRDLANRLQKVSQEATDRLAGLEGTLERRVSEMLKGFEVPTGEDFSQLANRFKELNEQVAVQLDRLEDELEARVTLVLERLGVPTREELERLAASVAELSDNIAALERTPAAKPAATRKQAVKKGAAKA